MTREKIMKACDRAMLAEVRRGSADPRVRDAFRRQLVAGSMERLEGGSVERQVDFTVEAPVEPNGQALLW